MSRTLAILLDAEEPDFTHRIREWEAATGAQGYDVRLSDAIAKAGHRTMQHLGLDVSDTTPRELYYALLEKARQDSNTLAAHLGIEPSDSPEVMTKKILAWLNKQEIPNELWVIKSSVMRGLLKKQSPKQLMKALGFRSIDSVLKRTNPSELLALAGLLEKPEWIIKFKAQYKKLSPTDFNAIKASMHVVKSDQAEKLRAKGLATTKLVNPCYETGVIVVLCPEKRFTADVLTMTTAIIETLADMRRHSAYFRSLSPLSKFGTYFMEVCTYGLQRASMKRSMLHWNPVHRYLVGNKEFTESLSQPHFGHDDLSAANSSQVLVRLDPRYNFWHGNEHAIYFKRDGGKVSLHIADAAVNASNQSHFEHASTSYAKNRLSDELWAPYLHHREVGEAIVNSFLSQEQL